MKDEITSGVAQLYAEYPYPDHGVVCSKIARMLTPMIGQSGEPLRLLDAGCGTGENTLGIARAFPQLEVVGIDLNSASVARADALARREGIEARFECGNLLEPIDHLGNFDIVVSIGVIHHLSQPQLALEHLRAVASDGGRLLGMLYGHYGMWESFQTRDGLQLLAGDDASRGEALHLWQQSICPPSRARNLLDRAVARRYPFDPPHLPWSERLRRLLRERGRRSAAVNADLLTHVQELTFTYSEVADLLRDTGWVLDGWARRSGMPDAPEQAFRGDALARLKGMSMLQQAEIYERLFRPRHLYFVGHKG